MSSIKKNKYQNPLLKMFLVLLFFGFRQNIYSQQSIIGDKQIHYNTTIDTFSRIKNFPSKMIDKSLVKSLPQIILDTLRKSYKDYYIPNFTRCDASGRGNIKISEKPFSINGDFNNDGITDYAFILESYSLNFYHEWSQEIRTIVFSSIGTDKYQIFEFGGSSGIGGMYKIERGLVKLEKDANYLINGNTVKFDSDKILMISWGNDVGEILDWDGTEYKRRELWDFL